ncbi:MAG: hypothetical protein A2Y03_10825 [Omnitrophica WOR_2 bacterium GWF2_38_59]|nr:MAG: hypothetical protein A2Y03_10825 [Omnitrophica WOR_2 bacterium GWF2_38_59]OGX50629.1 MAG: hypothetical protein A2243_03410 [Omnitrophica WOR_2 bacterium RIFOXYA2_FULL_38_17]OGX53279.1 MAG: hypothetical protein A2267_03505 [Omnitrophica WOR_2 bacterium RIFOXYA12_FULL_38_10]OGX56190.1 MAG: hypothetical protein A2447_08000 [Omnitrophica WOR_2 bacterium RIFOXYC2_FULL_38_12]OGX57311.1 MAG: hypothetical protein A2306_01980 [Omnitrophica WOR_2 bacterium RIFOXYB2_FULL_38_16]HBG60955.1 hypothet
MKNLNLILIVLFLSGCATVNIPNYIVDENPYKQKLYASFDTALNATVNTLKDAGWEVEEITKPSVFERSKDSIQGSQEVLLFTKIRETSMFLGSSFSRMNVYVRSGTDNVSEVEIRCITVNSVVFNKFTSYKKDRAVEKIFKHIQERLNNQKGQSS